MYDLNHYQFTTIKCYFSSILNKSNPKITEYKQIIQNSITDINVLISLLYDYIKLKILYDYNNDNYNSLNFDNRNDINKLLLSMLKIYTIDKINKKEKMEIETKNKIIDLINFINNNKLYSNIPDRNRTTEILKEVLNNMITHIKVNIQEHYIQHLKKFIRLAINNYDKNKENQSKFYSFILNEEYNKTKEIIKYNELSDKLKSFYNEYKHIFVLEDYLKDNEKHRKKSLHYIIKCKPLFFLKSMYYINKSFEDFNNIIKYRIKTLNNPNEKKKLNQRIIKLFNILPSKNNYYNGYVPFSTTSLAYLLNINITKEIINEDNTTSIIQDKDLIEKMYNSLFNFNKIIKQRNLIFYGHFETDGIGCSLQFYNLNHKKNKNKKEKNKQELTYLDNAKNKKELKNNKIIGIDPGKYNILYMSDGNKKLRYTIHQRKYECGIFKKQNYIDKLKNNNNDIKKIETNLSNYNSKTNYYNEFKKWLEEKYKVFDELYDFYNIKTIRRLKMEIYQKTQQSESKLIKNIRETFKLKNEYGNDLILVFGDWSDEPEHKTGETTINKNLKRKLSKHFKNCYLVDEYNTSKLCCKCGRELEKYNDKHRLLICKDCRLNKNQYSYKYFELNVDHFKNDTIKFKDRYFTRDMNSCLNMIRLAEHIISGCKEEINLGKEERKRQELKLGIKT